MKKLRMNVSSSPKLTRKPMVMRSIRRSLKTSMALKSSNKDMPKPEKMHSSSSE